MGQNRSSAVMQQRAEAHDSLDDFPTPPWATRALCDWLVACPFSGLDGFGIKSTTVREPAANRGHMARPLAEYFSTVEASDVHDYGAGYPVEDYLFGPDQATVDWTITNPPFRLAEQFIDRALRTSRLGVAVIVRSAFLEGQGRYQNLFSKCPPTNILQFTERVLMLKGRLVADGAVCPVLGRTVTSATSCSWLVWRLEFLRHFKRQPGVGPADFPGTKFHWIAPCRKRLERTEDYQ